jgi:hypothetical protein
MTLCLAHTSGSFQGMQESMGATPTWWLFFVFCSSRFPQLVLAHPRSNVLLNQSATQTAVSLLGTRRAVPMRTYAIIFKLMRVIPISSAAMFMPQTSSLHTTSR